MGLCFQVQKELGRFCREKQYADKLEDLLRNANLNYKREYEITNLMPQSPAGNKVDFLIEGKIIIELKAKNFITKEDYVQTQRYLRGADLKLGLIINFRDSHLKAKRVLNSQYSDVGKEFASFASNLHHSHRSGGYIALITVLVTGAVGVAITVSLILLGLGSSRTSFSLEQSNQAKALANACSEEALQQIRDSTPFTGTGNLTLGRGTCAYAVVNDGAQNRTVSASGTVRTGHRANPATTQRVRPDSGSAPWAYGCWGA